MPRTCTVCAHDEAHLINVELVATGGNRRIATQYGLSEAAVRRHRQEHIPELLVKAKDAVESAEADDLLGEVRELQTRTLSILDEAEGVRELRTALGAIREARANLELLAKLRQLIDTTPTVNILIAPQAQQVIVRALTPYPDARLAVADALDSLEAATP